MTKAESIWHMSKQRMRDSCGMMHRQWWHCCLHLRKKKKESIFKRYFGLFLCWVRYLRILSSVTERLKRCFNLGEETKTPIPVWLATQFSTSKDDQEGPRVLFPPPLQKTVTSPICITTLPCGPWLRRKSFYACLNWLAWQMHYALSAPANTYMYVLTILHPSV